MDALTKVVTDIICRYIAVLDYLATYGYIEIGKDGWITIKNHRLCHGGG